MSAEMGPDACLRLFRILHAVANPMYSIQAHSCRKPESRLDRVERDNLPHAHQTLKVVSRTRDVSCDLEMNYAVSGLNYVAHQLTDGSLETLLPPVHCTPLEPSVGLA